MEATALRSNLWKLKAIRAFFWMHFFSAIMVPFYTDGAHLSLTQVLILNSWFMFWCFALEVPTGTVADYFGRKWSLALGAVVGGLACLLYASQMTFLNFLIGEILFAVAYTLHSGADEAMAYDTLKSLGEEDQAKGLFSEMESFKLGGVIVGTLTGGFIAAKYGLSAPMICYVLPAAITLILSLTLHEPKDGGREQKLGYTELIREGFAYFKNNTVLLLLTIEVTLTHALAWGLIWLFQPLLELAGVQIQYFGVVHAFACGAQILFFRFAPNLEEMFGSKRTFLLFCSLITGLAFIDLAFLDNKYLVALAIVVGFAFSLPRVVLFSAYMNKYIPSDKRATVLSISSMIRTLSIVIINPIIGKLADWNLHHTMMILGVLIIAATVASRLEEKHLE